MEPIAYLTKYDGLLCADCALDTDALVPDGDGTFSRWLNGLTAIPATDVLQDWPEACCEECKRPFALSAAWSR